MEMSDVKPQRHRHSQPIHKKSQSSPFDISTAELVSLGKKERGTTNLGSWTGYAKHPCGFIMKGSNNSHSDIKHRLHLKVCKICRDDTEKQNLKVLGSLTPFQQHLNAL